MKTKNGFTMIEMVFVIVVLGILAAIAVPRFAATRVDAEIAKGRADVASVRSAIVSERQSRLIKGDTSWISAAKLSVSKPFDGVLMYPAGNKWSGSQTSYIFTTSEKTVGFTYDPSNGTFKCTSNCSDGFSDFQ